MSTPSSELRRLIRAGIGVHEAVATRLGLNPTDLLSLELLGTEEDVTPGRLAELMGLTTGAATGILDRLERAGYVRREADPSDRRRVLVRPDPERMAELEATYGRLMHRTVSAHGRDGLGRTLAGLADALTSEAERLRVETHGGIIDDAYRAPLGDVSRARLLLASGAPRLNVGASALGQQVRMVAETAATRLTLRPGTASGELIHATFEGPAPGVRSSGGTVTMRYRRRLIDTRSRHVTASLHPAPAWAVEVDGGITDLDADLSGLHLLGIEVRGGANHARLQLPVPSGTVRIALDGGSSRMSISRPAHVPVALHAPDGVSRLRFDDQARTSSATELRVESAGYHRAPDRYELELAGGISDLLITEG